MYCWLARRGSTCMNIPQINDLSVTKIGAFLSEQTWNLLNFFGKYLDWVPFFVLLVCLYYLIGNIYGRAKKGLENTVFMVYCANLTLLTSIDSFLSLSEGWHLYRVAGALTLISNLLFIFLPAIYCLHVWTQVSFKPININKLIHYLFAPCLIGFYLIFTFSTSDAPGSACPPLVNWGR